jgi:hypothetical protein
LHIISILILPYLYVYNSYTLLGVYNVFGYGEDADMSVMEKELNDFTERKDIKKAAETDRCVRKMLTQIKKYKDRLFTDGVS